MTGPAPGLLLARAASQLLAGPPAEAVAAVVVRLGALQAQDLAATRLAVRARTTGLVADDVDPHDGMVRTWLMRGTLHLVSAADAGWMVGLLGPVNRAKGARRRAQLGLDDAVCSRGVAALAEALADGPLDRAAVVSRLASLGVALGPDRQAAPHLLAYAASLGVVCLGPEAARNRPTYQLLAAATSTVPADAAATELARRYLGGHQPAGPADFAAWSGLSARAARAAFDALGDSLEAQGPFRTSRGAVPATAGEPVVRMVGHFDPYLLGYADKTAVVPERFVARVRTGGGFVTPTVLVDGRAVATWRLTGATLSVEPFEPLADAVRAGIHDEIADLSRFLATPLTVKS